MLTHINTKRCQNSGDIRIMIYPTKYDIDNGSQESVEDVIKGIQTKISRSFIDKEQLPVAYFSVVRFKGNKTSENVTEHTGLIVIDIDVHDNPNTDFEMLYNNLQWNNNTFACFRSPSKGIKLVIKTDIQDVNHHYAYYQAITEYLLNRYRELQKIDTSGSNISRACYLPFDHTVFLNPFSEVFSVSREYINEFIKTNPLLSKRKSVPKPLLQVEYLSYDEHFENIKYILKNWTSMGQKFNLGGTSVGKWGNEENLICENQDETSVGYSEEMETSMGQESNQRTLVGYEDDIETSMGLYDSIFNEYRFNNIRDSVMSTTVPLFEFLVLKNNTPSSVEHKTRLDEKYFRDNANEPISTDSIEGLNGLDVCEVNITSNTVFKEGHRGKTLSLICMKLIYNNPFCHPKLILKELMRLNYFYCQDQNPETNPAPDEKELNAIVSSCYQRFIDGELDFSTVMRKKKTKDEVSRRKVFWSRHHDKMDSMEKQRKSIKIYAEGKRGKNIRLYEKTIYALQDGNKITQKRIADHIKMSTRQLRRYRQEKSNAELLTKYDEQIKKYNETLKTRK